MTRTETALAVSQAKYWHLKQVGLFSSLADLDIRQLVNISDLRLFKRGEEVYRTGDLSEQIFILRTGKVKLCRTTPDGREIILGFEGPGDLFGELAVTGELQRHESAHVVEDAFICMIDRDRFTGYLREHSELALQITQIIARRKLEADQRMIDLLSKDVKTRLAHALVKLAEDFGDTDDDGDIEVGLRLTQTDLGQLVGSTRETTSMAFNAFRRDGLVDAKDRIVTIRDVEGLRAV